MEIKGKVIQVMPVRTGQGRSGPWHSQDFVLETLDKYPKKVCMTIWGEENINKYDLVEGMTITPSIELESREYNGKWYTNIKAWKITWEEQKRPDFPTAKQVDPEPQNETMWPPATNQPQPDVTDLPF